MRILANVTSSLRDDFDEMIERVSSAIAGDTYIDVTRWTEDTDVELDDYDIYINLWDDDEDILDRYHRLIDYAKASDRMRHVMSYYKAREAYTSAAVYYVKKDVNHDRLHRFMSFESLNDVVFDLMMYAAVYYDADVSSRDGVLTFKNYGVISMDSISSVKNSPLLMEYYNNIALALHDEQERTAGHIIDSRANLLELEDIHEYMRVTRESLDLRLLRYISLYKEIIKAETNSYISTLDYICVKEYFRIGHLTSIASCFNRSPYVEEVGTNKVAPASAINILKIITYSMSFSSDNVFVKEIFSRVLNTGKNIELEEGKDEFFHFHLHDFLYEIENFDENYASIIRYTKMIESGVLEPNPRNISRAYYTLAQYAKENEEYDDALDYATKARDYVYNDIGRVNVAKILYDIYTEKGDTEEAQPYRDAVMDSIELMNTGYHNDYIHIVMDMIDLSSSDERVKAWSNDVIDRVEHNVYIDKLAYYTLATKRIEQREYDINERVSAIRALLDDMIRDFYLSPITMYINIYTTYIVLAMCYETLDQLEDATECYRAAYLYMTTLEEVDDIDEHLGFVDYRLAEIDSTLDSTKSYRRLVRAERHTYKYIMDSANYVFYYGEILLSLAKRYFGDSRYRTGSMIARDGYNKLDMLATMNVRYLKDAYRYALAISDMCNEEGMTKYKPVFTSLAEDCARRCREKDVDID